MVALSSFRGSRACLLALSLVSCVAASDAEPEEQDLSEVRFYGVPIRGFDASLPEVDAIGYDLKLSHRGEVSRPLLSRLGGSVGPSERAVVFDASCTVTYVATSSIEAFPVNFFHARLKNVKWQGRALTTSALDPTTLRVNLGKRVAKGKAIQITFDYEIIPKELARLTSQTPSGLIDTGDTFYTASWPTKGRYWLPLRDAPKDGAMFAAALDFPSGYTLVANGDLLSRSTAGGRSTATFVAKSVMPPYDFFVGASKAWVERDLPSARSGKKVATYMRREHDEAGRPMFEFMPRALDFYESHFGAFRFERAGFVEAPTTWGGGGMEHATIVAIDPLSFAERDKELRHTAAHELAHHWGGNLLRVAFWADLWLSEGFTDYMSFRFLEDVDPDDAAQRWRDAKDITREITRRHPLRPIADDTNVSVVFDSLVYKKGAWVLQVIENKLGRTKFDAFLRGWFTRNAFSAVSTRMLQSELERETSTSFDTLFKKAVYGIDLPE